MTQTNFDKVLNTAAWMRHCGWHKQDIIGAFELGDQGVIEENWEYVVMITREIEPRVANERSLSNTELQTQ